MYEAMLTGPQQMPVFSEEVLSPEDKRAVIAYLKKNEETPDYGGFTLGSMGPVSEGLFAWLVGIGTPRRRRGLDRRQLHPLEEEDAAMSEKRELTTLETEPIADPGLPEHEPRPTDVDVSSEKRAERQVAGLYGLSTIFTLLFCVSYFWFEVGDEPGRVPGAGCLQRRPGRLPRAWRCCSSASARSSGRAS